MRMREGTDEAFITILLQDRTPAICPEDLGRGQGQLQGHPSCSHAQKGPMLRAECSAAPTLKSGPAAACLVDSG